MTHPTPSQTQCRTHGQTTHGQPQHSQDQTQRRTPERARRHTPLDRLNLAAAGPAESLLLDCCGSRRWARRLAEHRPYPDVEALLAAADEASYDLTPADLREALAGEPGAHPLEGEPQVGVLAAHTALRAAHGAYEEKFGHAFLFCVDGFAVEERLDHVLAGIRTRLDNDADEEWAVTAEELRRLARGRLGRLATGGSTAREWRRSHRG
ncbi:2-oxo-4-hydroxy-4-carboxy-5-ureidoimidazoline decarboxylase [Streptomyces tubbatahanensis]|uniref:2-oxo-4-hydroxy-4-carboxy-5-ureidoimidazoline decarboxylase n=1 Tax=Streptomyces tubbatahanensis TaxID=2923272 RepID=A0ABY3XVS8_9ACTN|nr:2-oxo-4-hydroxy-4-carboxy-5-ureidoimidazoline decarboxylase [Streptomyces tubbatahanensis]UNS98591.1 2-oxo-4-hydroxy-4-carboxy-5-ureidoimidazoline decarboxylase [Streptomyces tubbatahanensis]